MSEFIDVPIGLIGMGSILVALIIVYLMNASWYNNCLIIYHIQRNQGTLNMDVAYELILKTFLLVSVCMLIYRV